MRFNTALGLAASAAVLTGFAALAYVVYDTIRGLWAMFMSLLLVMALGLGGDPAAVPPEVWNG